MGGVDLLDRQLSNYRIRIKGKKWWWPFFTNFIDVALVNAWRLHQIVEGNAACDQLQFKRTVAMALLHTEATTEGTEDDEPAPQSQKGRPSKTNFDRRTLLSGHLIAKDESNVRVRCRHCKSTTVFRCIQCNVGIHPKCFEAYHK